jgi:hypothetical protein
MTSELPDVPPAEPHEQEMNRPEGELPVDLSDFSQRLAGFGLGESPDPLLTESTPPVKRRSQS